MYARAVSALGDLVAQLPFPTRAALYARAEAWRSEQT